MYHGRQGAGKVSTRVQPHSTILLKSRMRHTRIATVLILAMLAFVQSWWIDVAWVHQNLEWAGYVLVILCVLGRSWCSVYIGGRKNKELVTDGPYSVVRSPLYVFSFLGVVGIGLMSGAATIAVLLAVIFALYYRTVVRREETHLTAIYGETFARYRARVPRWMPDFSLWRSRGEVMAQPAFVLRTMRDSSMFFLAFPLFEAIEHFQSTGLLPVFLRLP